MSAIAEALARDLADRYRIEAEIGAGGMATVYRAEDLKHHRTVAIKVLHPELAAVIGAERFLAEIRTTANLQHPHILPLFDSGEAAGFLFYVMPLVDGESLRDRLDRETQLPVDEAIRICDGVAAALDYAHRQGIVHRDIKPANILLHDGQPLVADFGIALAVTSAGSGRLTETGLSLGTPHYMSPEQAAGDRSVDARSDVYALGSVLYEMLAGAPPFAGATPQAVLAKVLTMTAGRVSAERRSVPPHVDAVVARAVEKVPADRFGTVADFRTALADEGFRYAAGGSSAAATPGLGATSPRGVPLPVALVGGVALALVAAWGWLAGGGSDADTAPAFKALWLERPAAGWEDGDFAISPDGTQLVHVDTLYRLAVLPLDGGESRVLAEDGGFRPTFSPNGSSIAYIDSSADLMAVPIQGGAPRRLGEARLPFNDFVWAADGYIYQGAPDGPLRIPESGGVPEAVPHPADVDFELVQDLPDGRLLVLVVRADRGRSVAALDPATGQFEEWANQPEAGGVVHAFYRNGVLFWADALLTFKAAVFDVRGAGVTGEPIVLANRVGRGAAFGIAAAVADDGTLLLEQGASATSGLGENLGWIDLDGNIDIIEPEWSEQFSDFDGVALGPDARYAAVQVDMTGLEASAIDPAEIWILDLQERSSYRLTFDGISRYPAWLPDGRVAYLRESTDEFSEVLAQPYDRSGPETSLLQIDRFVNAFTVAPDGTLVLEIATGPDGIGIYLAEPGRPESLRPFVDSQFAEFGAAVSPDGRWLAYASEESGQPQLFVRSFPEGGRPWPISRGLGVWPLWGPDSETLFYLGGRRMEFAMLDTSDGLSVQGRGSFFQTDVVEIGYGVVHPDGDRILMTIEPTASEGARRLRLFTDVFAEIERRIEGS